MSQMSPPTPTEEMSGGVLPDISPLVEALSSLGIEYEINGKSQIFGLGNSAINLNDSNHCLSYSFIIPVDKMLTEKKLNENWKIGIYSEGGRPSEGGPGISNPARGPVMSPRGIIGSGMSVPDMNASVSRSHAHKGQERMEQGRSSKVDLRKMMMNDIEVWIPFSFSQICSLEKLNDNTD